MEWIAHLSTIVAIKGGSYTLAIKNYKRSGCKDIFNAFLVSSAEYADFYEFPILIPSSEIPKQLISFSKAIHSNDYNNWVHFYEDDVQFERFWRTP